MAKFTFTKFHHKIQNEKKLASETIINWYGFWGNYFVSIFKQAEKLKSCEMKDWCWRMKVERWRMNVERWRIKVEGGFEDGRTYERTNERTFVIVKSLSRLKKHCMVCSSFSLLIILVLFGTFQVPQTLPSSSLLLLPTQAYNLIIASLQLHRRILCQFFRMIFFMDT